MSLTHQEIVKRPLISEKSEQNRENLHRYAFEVHREATKIQVKAAVEKLFSVHVTTVHTAIARGKIKRVGKNIGRRPNWKKAIVTLKEGETISLFEGS